MKKDKLVLYFQKSVPFLLILLASILPLIIYFSNGIPGGDDMVWHLGYMYDLYYGFKNGFTSQTPSHLLMGSYGYQVYLFYGPFMHYLVVLLTLAFEWAGASIIGMMKFVTIAGMFISGVYTYLLAKKITKSSQIATVFAIAFCFFPYRMEAFLYRAAFCEGMAISLIPIVFYALYRILHDEEPRVAPYLTMIIGMSALILTHPFSALITVTALVVIILANTFRLIKIFSHWQSWLYTLASIALIFGFISFYFFPMSAATNSGLYRLSDRAAVWMDLGQIARSLNLQQGWTYSGFLNFQWIINVASERTVRAYDTPTAWGLSLAVFIFSGAATILVDYFLRKYNKLRAWRTLICLAVSFIIPVIYWCRPEIYEGLAIFDFCYLYFEYGDLDNEMALPARFETKKVFRNPDIYASALLFIGFSLLLFTYWPWTILPDIYQKAQFPFRIWGILSFVFFFMLMPLLAWTKGHKTPLQIMALLASLLLVVTNPVADKRIMDYTGTGKWTSITESQVRSMNQVGVMDEYCPIVFFDDAYKPTYSNSLYYTVKKTINSYRGFPQKDTDYVTPVYLEGSGTIDLASLKSPSATFNATITSATGLVQIPQFYYDGYQITLTQNDQTIVSETGEYVDGLLAFKVVEGTYTIHVDYIGSKTYRVGRVFFYLSIPLTVSLGVLGIFLKRKPKLQKPAESVAE